MAKRLIPAFALLLAGCLAAAAQDLGTLDPKPLPPLAKPDDPSTAAKELFGRKTAPAALEARAIGYYTNGCLAGGVMLRQPEQPLPTLPYAHQPGAPEWGVGQVERFAGAGRPDARVHDLRRGQ